ncbi:lactonase family protein [Streptomyces sp. NPDC002851]
MGNARAYIGSFTEAGGQGILAAHADPDTGTLTPLGSTAALPNPSYLALAPTGDRLYAVGENTPGTVAAFSLRGGTPTLLAPPTPVGGDAPTHLALAADRLLTANYGSGNVSWLPLRADGAPATGGVLPHRGSGPDPDRQEAPHAHQVRPDPSGRWVLTVDLGTDSVRVCTLDGTGLRLHREVPLRPGSGPRHLAFHPRGDRAYVLNELAPTLTTCHWNPTDGHLEPVDETPVLPDPDAPGDRYPSALVTAPDGRFVWTATRGRDVISVLAAAPGDAAPRLVTTVDCGGHWPRDLALHPSGRFLYAANERSGDVTWFALDPETGIPHRAGAIEAPAASCVVFGPSPEPERESEPEPDTA